MLFPVFGQIIGLALTFGLTIGLADKVASKATSMTSAMGIILLLALPGLLIFMKAFWDYLVAYGAINSMADGYLNTGKVYDFKSHNEVVLNKTFLAAKLNILLPNISMNFLIVSPSGAFL